MLQYTLSYYRYFKGPSLTMQGTPSIVRTYHGNLTTLPLTSYSWLWVAAPCLTGGLLMQARTTGTLAYRARALTIGAVRLRSTTQPAQGAGRGLQKPKDSQATNFKSWYIMVRYCEYRFTVQWRVRRENMTRMADLLCRCTEETHGVLSACFRCREVVRLLDKAR